MSSRDHAASEAVDVVVVGSRVSGTALSIFLRRAGRSVMLVDRATFPSDTLSTHLMQVSGVDILARLGLLDRLRGTGAPFVDSVRVDYDKIDLDTPVYPDPGQPPGGISVSRNLLDEFLVDAATDEGVDVRLRTTLVDLLRDTSGRVEGVVLRSGGTRYEVRAPLVIGADGRNSRVAELAGAQTYNTTANGRFDFWADYTGVDDEGMPPGHQYRDGEQLTIAFRSDNDRFTVVVAPGMEHFAEFKANLPESYDRLVASCPQLEPVLRNARRVTRPIGTAYLPGYFRDAGGRGWALVGDAGHFKDPTIAQGISDALRQAERLAGTVGRVDPGDRAGLDRATRAWWRWRDRDATPMYWLAYDFSQAGPMGPLERELLRVISESPEAKVLMIDKVMSHRLSPYRVITAPRIARAAVRLVRSGQCSVRETAGLLADRIGKEVVRTYRQHRPLYGALPKAGGAAARSAVLGDAWAGSADGRAGDGAGNAQGATHRVDSPDAPDVPVT